MSSFATSGRFGRIGVRPRMAILVLVAIAPLLGLLIAAAIADREVALAYARSEVLAAANGRLLMGLAIAILAMAGAASAAWLFSSRKAAEDAVRANDALLRGVFDHAPNCIMVNSIAADGTVVLATYNRAAATAMGIAVNDMNGKPLHQALPPAVAARMKADLDHCIAGGEVLQFENASLFGKGRRKWDVILVPIFDEHGTVARVVVTARETTERKLAEDLIRESSERYRLIAANVADLVVRLGHDLTCGFVSPASRDLLGCEPEELIALPLADIVHPEDRVAFRENLRRLQTSSRVDEFRFRACHADGSHIWVEATGRRLTEGNSIILAIRDISRRKQMEDELAAANLQLEALALHDGLTGLANRRSFDQVLDGHQAGDDCLCAVAKALQGALLRPGDFAARYGGEEFVVVLPNTNAAGTIAVAERIRRSVAEAGLEHRGNPGGIVTISAGTWASTATPPSNPRDALTAADQNLYAAKAAGRNRVGAGPLPLANAG